MWAQQLTGPAMLQPVEVPAPAAGDLRPGEVLVALEHGGICGSDLPHFRAGGRPSGSGPVGVPPPGFPLHEVVGRVRASRDPDVPVGDRVVGWASAADGLAELVVTAGAGLHPVDGDGHGPATVVAQPLACVLYAVDQLGDLRGKRVAVLGLGSIGLLFTWALRQYGAATVVGVDPVDRTAHTADFGLDEVLVTDSLQWSESLDAASRPDVIVEAVGHQTATVADAVRSVADQGTVYCFGIPVRDTYPVDLNAVVRRNLRIIGGLTRERRSVLGRALGHLQRFPHLAERLVTDLRPGTEAAAAFAAACTPRAGRLKHVLEIG